MRKMRLLTVLAAMLLSCGIANAQTEGDENATTPTNEVVSGDDNGDEKAGVEITSGDVNQDGKLNIEDVAAAADSILDNKQGGSADVYKDQKVNAIDVVTVVNLIKETDYFLLGTEAPTNDNYTTVDGVVTTYESIAKALEAALTVEVEADQVGVLLCPASWEAENLVLQNEEDGTIYELKTAETDINDYALFQTEKIEAAATLKLKTKADAEEYQGSLTPDDPKYFWLGNTYPTSNNFPMLGDKEQEGIVTTYTSLDEAMEKASRVYSAGEWAVVLYPLSWGEKDDLVFLDSTNKNYYETKKKTPSDFPAYLYFESTEKIGANTTITLSTKKTAEDAGATLYVKPDPVTPVNPDPVTPVNPDPVTPVNPDPVPVAGASYAEYTGGNGIRFVLHNNCGVEARFRGDVIINVSRNPNDWGNSTQVNANMHGPTSGSKWAYNDIIIPPGGFYTSPVITTIDNVYPQYAGVNFTDGSWYFMNYDTNGGIGHTIFLYTTEYSRSRNKVSGSNHMYGATPLQNQQLLRGYTYHLNVNWVNPAASLWPNMSGSSYIILGEKQTGL